MPNEPVEKERARTIDQKQTSLQDRPPSQLLTPRRPKLAPKRIRHQENHLSHSHRLQAHIEMCREERDRIGKDRGVEVHGDLDGEDDGEDLPFPPGGPGVAEEVVGFVFGELALAVWSGSRCFCRFSVFDRGLALARNGGGGGRLEFWIGLLL